MDSAIHQYYSEIACALYAFPQGGTAGDASHEWWWKNRQAVLGSGLEVFLFPVMGIGILS